MIGGGSGGVVVENCCHLLWGRCGLKFQGLSHIRMHNWSPSVRKVWIEMCDFEEFAMKQLVTFCEEGVDWNHQFCNLTGQSIVTFCEEGVDWNGEVSGAFSNLVCHLLWGRCGLKFYCVFFGRRNMRSPSVRKVWIEILCTSLMIEVFLRSPSARKVSLSVMTICLEITISPPFPPLITTKRTFRKQMLLKVLFFWWQYPL